MAELWVVVGVSALLAVAIALTYALVTRYGRVLLRLDEVERRLAELTELLRLIPSEQHAVALDERHDGRTTLRGELPLIASRIERDGLAPGTRAPEIDLVDLHNAPFSLSRYRNRRVLLVFSDPACGPCDIVVSELARIDRERGEDCDGGLAFVLVGRGDLEANRRKVDAHDVRFPVLVQRHWEISRQYGIFATPVAFLIDPGGVIQQGVARGVDQILALTHEALVNVKNGDAYAKPFR